MKRFNLFFKHCASLIHPASLAVILVILFALDLSTTIDVRAQRHGSSFHGRSGMSAGNHIGQSYNRMNNSHMYIGNFGHREHFGSHFYRYRSVPYWRYPYMPFWGDYYWGIPPYSLRFYLNGYYYYDDDGIYYKYDNDKYQVVPAPIGHKLKTLPKGNTRFTLDGVTYFYYFGTYYTSQDGQYVVVQPPIGAEVDSIPDGYEKVMIDGQTYFTLNGVQYKAVLRDNVVWYRVIKNNADNAAQSNSPKDKSM